GLEQLPGRPERENRLAVTILIFYEFQREANGRQSRRGISTGKYDGIEEHCRRGFERHLDVDSVHLAESGTDEPRDRALLCELFVNPHQHLLVDTFRYQQRDAARANASIAWPGK